MPSELSATNSSNTFAEDVDDQQNQRVLFSEVVAVLNELGHYNRLTNTYQLNIQDHSSCLRDLIRLLRNDGQNFLVRRQMGLSNIVENDLLPIVEQHTVEIDCRVAESGKSIMDKVVRLLVDLTNPTVLHYRDQQIPKEDKHEAQIYLELQSLLANYKLAFSTHKRFWIVLSKHLTTILELDDENRQLEDDLMLERIIVLIRNVLHIPLIVSRQQIEEDTNAHDRIIEQLNHSGILDIIQFMLASKEHNQYIFHMIEIMYLIFREQDAEFLAKSVESNQSGTSQQSLASNRSLYEREIDRKEFDEARVRDRQQRIQMMEKMKADDYTRFNGSAYVVKNLKSISDRDMICHRAYSKPEKAIDLNQNKVSQRRTRNRKPMIENAGNNDSLGIKRIHRSNRQLRSILYEFCIKFLTETYNGFMFEIHSNLSRGNAQEHDETYFLWAIQFFMEFSRCRVNETPEMKYKQVYQTLSTSTFHYLQTLVDNYLEHLGQKKIFKNELTHWSKRLHCALRSYRELLYSLASLDRLNLAEASKTCHRIKSDIFTEPEYRELLLRLLQSYSEEQMSKAFLRDLIETNHVFLKMLDYHSKISYNFKVKVKKRKAKKRSKKVFAEEKVRLTPEEVWLEILDDLNTTLNGGECEEHCFAHLFNPLSKKSFEEQKLTIMQHIRQHLMDRNVSKAVSLFRQARAVYSSIDEHNTFGEAEIPVEDEMVALSGILYADLPEIPPEPTEEDGEEEDSEENIEMQEKNFSIEDTLRRYAHPNVIRSYRQLLKLYRSNSECTNHAIVRMLYRIAVNLKMVPMFYNLGYFVLFEQILDDPELKKCDSKKKPTNVMGEMAMFAYYVLHSFFKLLGRHPKISAEICFVANSRDAYAMEFGFEEEQVKQSIKQRKSNGWTEEQELELEVLYKEYKDKATKENDIVDLIQQHLIDDTKTRRQIIIQLKRMVMSLPMERKSNWIFLLSFQDLYEGKNSKAPAWTEEENEELRTLFERFKANTEAEIQLEESKDKETLSTTIEEFPSSQDLIAQMENGENEPTGMNEQSQPEVKKSKRQDVISRIWNHLSTRDKRNRRQLIRQLKLLVSIAFRLYCFSDLPPPPCAEHLRPCRGQEVDRAASSRTEGTLHWLVYRFQVRSIGGRFQLPDSK